MDAGAVKIHSRKPTTEERRAATRLAADLRRVSYPTRAKTKVREQLPPGRVNPRRHMLKQQQRRMHQPVTAKPYTTIKRDRVVHTEMKVGIIADISGSMHSVMEPVAVSRWVLADAVHQVNGRVATVLMGNYGYPIQAPHERVTNVEVFDANGRHENISDSFPLIDSALDLIDGEGARLLVMVTDMHFVMNGAQAYAEKIMDMCRRAGVAVLWLNTGGYVAREDAYGHGEIVDVRGMSSIEMAETIGKAVVETFRRAAPQHSLQAA